MHQIEEDFMSEELQKQTFREALKGKLYDRNANPEVENKGLTHKSKRAQIWRSPQSVSRKRLAGDCERIAFTAAIHP